MAQHYTKKNEERTEKDVPAEEFVKKMVDLKRTTEERPQVFNTESKE